MNVFEHKKMKKIGDNRRNQKDQTNLFSPRKLHFKKKVYLIL